MVFFADQKNGLHYIVYLEINDGYTFGGNLDSVFLHISRLPGLWYSEVVDFDYGLLNHDSLSRNQIFLDSLGSSHTFMAFVITL